MLRAGLGGSFAQTGVLALVSSCCLPLLQRPPDRQITVHQIMCGGLIGDHIGTHTVRLCTTNQFRQKFSRIAEQADGDGTLVGGVLFNSCQRIIKIGRLLVEVAGAQTKVDARLLAFNIKRACAGKSRR